MPKSRFFFLLCLPVVHLLCLKIRIPIYNQNGCPFRKNKAWSAGFLDAACSNLARTGIRFTFTTAERTFRSGERTFRSGEYTFRSGEYTFRSAEHKPEAVFRLIQNAWYEHFCSLILIQSCSYLYIGRPFCLIIERLCLPLQ